MSGFFQSSDVQNPGAKEVWDKKERDKALDEYFVGANPKVLGIKYKGAPKAFRNSILNKLLYNFKKEGKEDQPGRAERYEPVQRASRKGKKFTPNELEMIRAHKEIKLPLEFTARILMRDVEEIDGSGTKGTIQTNQEKMVAPTVDIIWAHHYIHHRLKKKAISDQAYDDLVKEEIDFGGGEKNIARVKASALKDYPGRIRSLANYLLLTHLGIDT